MSLKRFCTHDVEEAAISLIRQNGRTTALDVKNGLRQRGFLANQKEVSNALRLISTSHAWESLREGRHLVYFFPSTGKSVVVPLNTEVKKESEKSPVIVLLTVNQNETHALWDIFLGQNKAPDTEPIGDVAYNKLGIHGGCYIVHAICEMGTGGIGASQQRTHDAIGDWKPAAVIAVGVAFGANEKKQKIGDVLVSAQLQNYELARLNPNGMTPRGDKPPCSAILLNRLRNTDTKAQRTVPDWPKVQFGLMLSGEKLVDNLDYRESLKRHFEEAIGGEMEGTGLYASAHAAKVDWIIIKGICDWGYRKNRNKKDAYQKLAAKNAALVLKTAIDGMLYVSKPDVTSQQTASPIPRAKSIHPMAFLEENIGMLLSINKNHWKPTRFAKRNAQYRLRIPRDAEMNLFNRLNFELFKDTSFKLTIEEVTKRNDSIFDKNRATTALVEKLIDCKYLPIGISHVLPLNKLGEMEYVERGQLKDRDFDSKYICSTRENCHAILLFSMGVLEGYRVNHSLSNLLLVDTFQEHVKQILPGLQKAGSCNQKMPLYVQAEHAIERLLNYNDFIKTDKLSADEFPIYRMEMDLR